MVFAMYSDLEFLKKFFFFRPESGLGLNTKEHRNVNCVHSFLGNEEICSVVFLFIQECKMYAKWSGT